MQKNDSKTSTQLRQELITRIKGLNTKPETMDLELEDKCYTEKFAFFPYGNGLYNGNNVIATNGIMVVGQDFGNIEYIKKPEFTTDGEAKQPTMRNFLTLKNQNWDDYFFTNLFMGLRKDKTMIGKNPALKSDDKNYLKLCYEFFEHQVDYIKPRVIIVLGKVPFEYLCKTQNITKKVIPTFSRYFTSNPQSQVSFNNIPMVCLPHPSMWNSNVRDKPEMEKFLERAIGLG